MTEGYVLMPKEMKDNIEQMQRELWEERCQKAAIALLEGKAVSISLYEIDSVAEWLQELKIFIEEENDNPDVIYKLHAIVVKDNNDERAIARAKYICL